MSSDILIIAAVESELTGLMQDIRRPVIREAIGMKVVSGYLKDYPVRLLTTGPGLVNTASGLTAAVGSVCPKLIIQTGCAGGFGQSGVRIGDIGIAVEEIDVQLGIESESADRSAEELPFPVIRADGHDYKHRYPLDRNLAEAACSVASKKFDPDLFRIHSGPFVTVSTITATDQRANLLYRCFHPCMESMEGSAAAHLSILFKIPLIEIRSASNLVGKRDKSAWNLPLSFQNCALGVKMLLESDDFYRILNEIP